MDNYVSQMGQRLIWTQPAAVPDKVRSLVEISASQITSALRRYKKLSTKVRDHLDKVIARRC